MYKIKKKTTLLTLGFNERMEIFELHVCRSKTTRRLFVHSHVQDNWTTGVCECENKRNLHISTEHVRTKASFMMLMSNNAKIISRNYI